MKKRYLVSLVVFAGVVLAASHAFFKSDASVRRKAPSARGQSLERGRLSESVALHARGRGKPLINLDDGHDLLTTYTVGSDKLQFFESDPAHLMSQSQPLALASSDFDEDGVPDLLSSYAGPNGSFLVLHRGNVDSIYPNTREAEVRKARGEFTDGPFLSPARASEAPVEPDFIGAGDFDADGHLDVVISARGGNKLYCMAGDGHGGFRAGRVIDLPGRVTAMTAGEVNRGEVLANVVVGIENVAQTDGLRNDAGSQSQTNGLRYSILVFEGSHGALKHEPERVPLPAAATSLALGQLSDSYETDLVAAAGKELVIVHRHDRKPSLPREEGTKVRSTQVEQHSMPFPIASLAIGNFTRNDATQIATLSVDGVVQVVEPDAKSKQWGKIVSEITTPARRPTTESEGGRIPVPPGLTRARVSLSGMDDLVIVDSDNNQLHIISRWPVTSGQRPKEKEPATDNRLRTTDTRVTTLDVEGGPVAVLPMRLNIDAFSDLVILKSGGAAPIAAALTAAARTFTVTNKGNSDDRFPGDGVCATAGNVCTLKAAIDEVNAGPGGDAINFSVTSVVGPSSFRIEKPVTIDGGASRVEIEPAATFVIEAANSTVRGLVIKGNGFGDAITVGNPQFGVAGNSFVEGNYIGTDVTGTSVPFPAPSQSNAIGVMVSTNDNTIGGMVPAARNVIAGFTTGVGLSFGLRNKVQGNYIGTDFTGTQALGNRDAGVGITAFDSTIGGTGSGAGNIIGFSHIGIRIGSISGQSGNGSPDGNAIRRNSIFGNTFGGISFDFFIARPPAPVLTASAGTLSGAKPNTSYTIEFFANPACDVFEQGKTFISDVTVLTDGNGNTAAPFNVPSGQNITATASAAGSNTSVFSNCTAGSTSSAQISLSPTQLSFSANVGDTNPQTPQNVTLTNTGGKTLNWQATATTTSGGTWLSVSPASGSLAANSSTALTVSAASNNLLSDIYTGTVTVSSADATNNPQKVDVTLTLGCPAGSNSQASPRAAAASCTDVLTLSNFAPAAGSKASERDLRDNGLKATITYLLASKPNADLVLRVFDQDGNRVGSSVIESKARPNPTPNLIPSEDFVIPGKPADCSGKPGCSSISLFRDMDGNLISKTLTMKALFINPLTSAVIKSSAPVTYHVVEDKIEILNPKVDGGSGFMDLDKFQLTDDNGQVDFQCDVRYTLVNGDPLLGGIILLEAFDISEGKSRKIEKISEPVFPTADPKIKANLHLKFHIPARSLRNFLPSFEIRASLLDGSGNGKILAYAPPTSVQPQDWLIVKNAFANSERVFSTEFGFKGTRGTAVTNPDDGKITLRLQLLYKLRSRPRAEIIVSVREISNSAPSRTFFPSVDGLLEDFDSTFSFSPELHPDGFLEVDVGFLGPGNFNLQPAFAQKFSFKFRDDPTAKYNLQNTRSGTVSNPASTYLFEPPTAASNYFPSQSGDYQLQNSRNGGASNSASTDLFGFSTSFDITTAALNYAPHQNVSAACTSGNQLQDPGFEASTDTGLVTNPFWPSTSTQFGTSLCSVAACGSVASAVPRNGTYWAG